MRRSPVIPALVAGSLLLSITSVVGCAPKPQTIVVSESGSTTEDTSVLTPLQRGKERTAAMKVVRAGLDAWAESDAEAMRRYFAAELVKRFEQTWDGYANDGLSVRHVHDVGFLDVTEMNKSGTQAIVTYTYKDKSYLVDASGRKVRDLPVIDKDMQLTLEKSGDAWRVERIIAVKDAYR